MAKDKLAFPIAVLLALKSRSPTWPFGLMTSIYTSEAPSLYAPPLYASEENTSIPSAANLLARAIARRIQEDAHQVESSCEGAFQRVEQLVQQVLGGSSGNRTGKELLDITQSEQIVRVYLSHLIALSKQIERTDFGTDSKSTNYKRQLLLTTILPIYLRSSSQSLSRCIANAVQIAWEHRILLSLNALLEGDLLLAIDESQTHHHAPLEASQKALMVDLVEVVTHRQMDSHRFSFHNDLNAVLTNHFESSRRESELFAVSPALRDGYWQIAEQWVQQREAITIPANLAVGAVSWPRLQSHWHELSGLLSNGLRASLHSNPSTSSSMDERQTQSSSERNKDAASKTSDTYNTVPGADSESLPDVIEIRSSNDPELAKNLDIHLSRCRERSGSLALVVIRCKGDSIIAPIRQPNQQRGSLSSWQLGMITTLQSSLEHRKMYGFYTTDGDLALIMEDVDRTEVTSLVRSVIEQEAIVDDHETRLLDQAGVPLYSGIACVQSPSKSFRLNQLIESAWRCLDASLRQPPGSVKSIEVY